MKENFPIYLTNDFKRQLQAEAKSDSRSLNNYIVYILQNRDQIPRIREIQKRANLID